MYDLLIKNGQCVTPGGIEQMDVGIRGGEIVALGVLDQLAARIIDATHLHVLPGVIDSQVHFRDPGLTHKEDLETGTKGAVLGGVTTVFEMPNTSPSTTTREAMEAKFKRASEVAYTNYAFYVGAACENITELPELERMDGCAGVKIFMGSSTGSLLVSDDETLLKVLQHGRRRVAIHAEDDQRLTDRKHIAEAEGHPRAHPVWRDERVCLQATQRIVALARQAKRPLHILHISTADEMTYLRHQKDICTVETLPQFLTFSAPECYERLGSKVQMNPPIREQHHQDALWEAIETGIVDIIATDHAPHTLEEKAKPYPQCPSGMTGVQTLVPVMLTHVNHGRLSLERFVDLVCAGPARVFGLPTKGRLALGYDADLTLVDMKKQRLIEDSWIASRSGWTPYDGMTATGWPTHTIVNGVVVMEDDTALNQASGKRVHFGYGL